MRRQSFFRLFISLAASVFMLFYTSCMQSGSRAAGGGSAEVPKVTVSVPPLAYFAQEIGGDSVEVSVLMGAGADPETFQPGMNAMRALNSSQLFLTTGVLPFEQSMLTNLRANTPDLPVVDAGKGITYLYGTHENCHDHSHNHATAAAHSSGDNGTGAPDPHIWSSVRNGKVIAANTLRALVAAAPSHKAYYTERYARLVARLDSLDSAIAAQLASTRGGAFVIWHPSLSYFANDYGLEQVAFNVEGKETSSLQLRRQLDAAAEERPLAFFVPEGLAPERVKSIADHLGLPPTPLNLLSADWEGQMRTVGNALTSRQ